jgi:hypothetical protein
MRPKNNSMIFRPDLGMVINEWAGENIFPGFIGNMVMPVFKTLLENATFPVIPIEALLTISGSIQRVARANYSRDDAEYERGHFKVLEFGHEQPLDDTERLLFDAESDRNLVAEQLAIKRCWLRIMLSQEKRIADKIFNESNFTAHPVTNEWDDATNASPINDIKAGKISVRSACGMIPNALIISYPSFEDLKNTDQIVNRLKYTFPGIDLNMITPDQLAKVLGVEMVLVGGAVFNSAARGKDAVISDIWSSEYAMLTVVNSTPDLLSPCIGRTFLWTKDSPENPIVESYREENKRCDIFRVRHSVDERLIQSFDDNGAVISNISEKCSYLLSNIHS